MTTPDLSRLAAAGTRFSVRVTPKAAYNRILQDADDLIRVYVTTVPGGRQGDGGGNKTAGQGDRRRQERSGAGATDRVKLFQVGR